MIIHSFKRELISNAIVVSVTIDNGRRLKMILDTGASNTTIDSNMLYLYGYSLNDSIGTVQIETANGIIDTEVFEMKTLSAFGLLRQNFQIQVYDFIAHSIISDFNGLLGLDFFEGTKFCIDTVENEITITEK
jgi:predicted aspartyl protease